MNNKISWPLTILYVVALILMVTVPAFGAALVIAHMAFNAITGNSGSARGRDEPSGDI